MRLPDVIGIGARRCGSSWVHHALNMHEEIGKPTNGLHFFSNNLGKGLEWYAAELAPFADRPVLLEFSVSYLYPEHNERAAERIAASVPDAKLFTCVRDPVSRAFSDYLRSVRRGEFSAGTSFEEALSRDANLIERGRFGRLLRPFYDRFAADRIKVLFYDDLKADRVGYIGQLTDYIGIGPVPTEAFERNEPRGKTVRSPLAGRLVKGAKALVDTTAERIGMGDAWSDWKGRHVFTYERLLELNHKEIEIPPGVDQRLRRELDSDIAELEAMTDRRLDAWRQGT